MVLSWLGREVELYAQVQTALQNSMKRTAAALLHEALANFEERGDVTACNDAELERILALLRRVVGSIELEQQKKPLLYRLFGVARHAGLGAQVPSCCDCWTLTALAVTSKAVQRLTKEHLYRACAIRLPAVRGGPPQCSQRMSRWILRTVPILPMH